MPDRKHEFLIDLIAAQDEGCWQGCRLEPRLVEWMLDQQLSPVRTAANDPRGKDEPGVGR
ncbi:hypothetical protein [Yoonia vestfoldensis]|uniref:hypothetical protein n=1 Tax=Yoonia vestfoldensis TaxID=245188 RepID=UPI00036A64BC|nr:hypothetical protein [Yoonia vestfoldensis]